MARRLTVESLEDRKLLAITWVNEGDATTDSDLFTDRYGQADAAVARDIVNRAIDEWERVVIDFDYDNDGDSTTDNEYSLTLRAGFLGTGIRGQATITAFSTDALPTAGTVTLDDNAGGNDWYFDSTPQDDAEFGGIADISQSTFVDITSGANSDYNDFYRTVVHEIGHVLGITGNPNAAIANQLVDLEALNGNDWQLGGTPLRRIAGGTGDMA